MKNFEFNLLPVLFIDKNDEYLKIEISWKIEIVEAWELLCINIFVVLANTKYIFINRNAYYSSLIPYFVLLLLIF